MTGEGGSIRIGAKASIGERCIVAAYKAGIEVGDRVIMAADCAFYSFNHQMEPGQPICDQPLLTRGPILIQDEVWLGRGVTVLSGVVVGKGAVIGAGSVVTRDIPAHAIAAGQPARVLRFRC